MGYAAHNLRYAQFGMDDQAAQMHDARWVLARTSRRAHLDLGERSSKSLRILSEHVIVTACRAHVNADAEVVPSTHEPLCSNCLRILRSGGLNRPMFPRATDVMRSITWLPALWFIASGWLEQVCAG